MQNISKTKNNKAEADIKLNFNSYITGQTRHRNMKKKTMT